MITATGSSTATPASPVGTYPITAAFTDPGNKLGSYTVTVVPGTLTITAASLTATANNASKVYGQANPAFTGTLVGLKNGDPITESFSTTAVANSPVGAYPITPGFADPAGLLANYTTSTVPGTLTITPAPLTLTIASVSRIYGAVNPSFSGTIAGLIPGDTITATYTAAWGAKPSASPGPIVPVFSDPGGKLPNYTPTIIGGLLTINPAPLTITAGGGFTRLMCC